MPGGFDGRLQRAGVTENCAAWRIAINSPKPDGSVSIRPSKPGMARFSPPSTRPSVRSQCAVYASDTRTCQLPPSVAWRASATCAPNAIR